MKLDEEVIKVEDISKLKTCIPTTEERDLLIKYLPGGENHANMANLETAGRFVAYMCQVCRLSFC